MRIPPNQRSLLNRGARAGQPHSPVVGVRHRLLMNFFVVVLVPVLWLMNKDRVIASSDSPRPVTVTVGAYLVGISDIDLRQGSCVADFWIWFRWQPNDSHFTPMAHLEVIDGHIEDSKGEVHKVLADGQSYAARRIRAIIRQRWDVARFPLDSQSIQIVCEDADSETDALIYRADSLNSGVAPSVSVPGWTICHHEFQVATQAYSTNYGDTSLSTGAVSEYSRFVVALTIRRPGWGLFVKIFAGLFAAVAIALLSLFICPTHVDPRFGLPVGAMFAAIASQYVIASVLPESTEFTLADTLHVTSFTGIFLVLVESVISLALFCAGRKRASRWLDRVAFTLLLCGFLASVFMAIKG